MRSNGEDQPGVSTVETLADDAPVRRRPGPKPGSPKIPGSGRKRGQNKLGREGRVALAERSDWINTVARIASGKPVRVAGPKAEGPKWHHPSFAEMWQAIVLVARKTMPDVSAIEMTGEDGAPLNAEPVDPDELARQLALLLSLAGSDSGAGDGRGVNSSTAAVGSPLAHNFSSHAGASPVPEIFPTESAASLTADASAGLESREGVSSSAASIAAPGPAVFPTAPPLHHLLRFRGLTVCILNTGPIREGAKDDFFEARAGHVDWRAPGQVMAAGRFEACLKTVRVLASRAGVTELRFDVEPISRNPIMAPGGGSR